MPQNEIPSAFLIRALARHEAQHCDRCGHRMFVKGPSGLCPFCLSNRPARPVEHFALPVSPAEPFAPRLAATAGWQRYPLSRRFRDFVQRSRRTSKPAAGPLGLPAHAEVSHSS